MARVVGTALQIAGVYFANPYLFYAGTALNIGDAVEQGRRARRRDRALFNAAQKDRLEMVDRDSNQARTLAMGRVRAVEGVRRPWQSGTHLENLTLPVSFAGHEIDGYEQFYLHDTPVTLDGSGWVNEAPWAAAQDTQYAVSGTLDGSGSAVVVLGSSPLTSPAPTAIWTRGTGDDQSQGLLSVSMAGATATITGGSPGDPYTATYFQTTFTKRVRIRPYWGLAAQSIGGDLSGEYPGKLRSTDHYRGIAMAVMDCVFDPDVFPQGRPELTALFRGAKLYDPRKDSTVPGGSGAHRWATPSTWEWSENPALMVLRYATWEFGMAVPVADVSMPDIMEAATACDVPTVFTLRKTDGSTSTVTLPRYRCGIVISSAADRRASMDSIVETMAGRWCWAGGVLRLRAGVKRTAVATLSESWLSETVDAQGSPSGDPVISGANGVARDRRINRVTGRCVDPSQRYQMLPFPAVQDAVLVAAKGVRADEIDYEGVNHIAHAQHLASVAIRQAQAGLRMDAQCGLRALKLDLLDVVALSLPDYGFAGNEAEVVGWNWSPNRTIRLNLEEIAAAIYTVDAELKGRDPAPDSNLRKPWEVEQITGLAVTSGTVPTQDGSILTRTTITWAAVVGETVRRGGDVEVQYVEAGSSLPAGDWPSWSELGNSTKAVIPALPAGRYHWFRARAVQRLPLVRGAWSVPVRHQVASVRASEIFRQDAEPTGDVQNGDEWYDTNDGNKHYVRAAGSWVALTVGTGAMALGAATEVAEYRATGPFSSGSLAINQILTVPAGSVSLILRARATLSATNGTGGAGFTRGYFNLTADIPGAGPVADAPFSYISLPSGQRSDQSVSASLVFPSPAAGSWPITLFWDGTTGITFPAEISNAVLSVEIIKR